MLAKLDFGSQKPAPPRARSATRAPDGIRIFDVGLQTAAEFHVRPLAVDALWRFGFEADDAAPVRPALLLGKLPPAQRRRCGYGFSMYT